MKTMARSFRDRIKFAWADQTWITMWKSVIDIISESATPLGWMMRQGTGSRLKPLVEGKSPSTIFPLPLLQPSAAFTIAKPNHVTAFANLLMCVQNLLYFGGPKVSHFQPSKAQQRLQMIAVERAERLFEAVVTVPTAADIVDFVKGGEGGTAPLLLCWLWTRMQVCPMNFDKFPCLMSCVRRSRTWRVRLRSLRLCSLLQLTDQ